MRYLSTAVLGTLVLCFCGAGFAAEFKTPAGFNVKKVALTFDDGPDENVVPILEMVTKAGGKATFFFSGSNVEKLPDVAKKVIEAGSEIGNHSYSHVWFNAPGLSADRVREEVVKTQQIIKEKTGFTPVLWRSPFFKYTATLQAVLDEFQLTVVNANGGANDWEKNTTSSQVVERVTTKMSPGSIVLLHSWATCTFQALPDIIKYLKDNGYEMVTVSELMKECKKKAVIHSVPRVEGAESKLVKRDAAGRLVMLPWDAQGDRLPDFSYCGYRNGGVKLPDVPTLVTLEPSGAEDESARIQTALDDMGKTLEKTPDARGALLLKKGLWKVNKTLTMSYSGVVLRGEGDGEDGTVLLATMKVKTSPLISVSHKDLGPDDPTFAGLKDMLAQPYVPVGATRFKTTANNLKPGDEISIVRPGTQEWLSAIGMDAFPPATKVCQWKPDRFNLVFVRKVLSCADGELAFDIPLPQSLDQRYGGAFVLPAPPVPRIRECGVESLRVDSTFDPAIVATSGRGTLTNNVPVDENHLVIAVSFDRVEDAWLRNCTAIHLVNGLAVFGKFSRRVTAQDCRTLDPVSTLGGGRRYGFLLYRGSNQILVQRCSGRNNRHDFLTGSILPGPNAFVDCSAECAWDGTENHQQWAMGTLFDGIRVSGPRTGLFAANRGRWGGGSGHGWTGNTTVFWNCASTVIFANQPPLGQNFMIGNSDPKLFDPEQAKMWINALNNPSGRNDELCEGTLQGTAWKEHPAEIVTPRSLYYAQLEARLGKAAVENVTTEEQRRRNLEKCQ